MTETTPTDHERGTLARAVTRAQGLARKGHATPIVAAVMDGSDVVAWGDNEVHLDNDPSRYAEIVAIAAACRKRESPDLAGLTLVTTLQPCEMCLTAMRFAGIERLIFAAGRPNVANAYFKFHGLALEDFVAASDGGIEWAGHLMEDDILNLYGEGAAGSVA